MSNFWAILKIILADAATLKDKKTAASLAALLVTLLGVVLSVQVTGVEVAGVLTTIGLVADFIETQLKVQKQAAAAAKNRGA